MGQILLLVQGAEAAGGTPGLTFSFGLGKPWHFPGPGSFSPPRQPPGWKNKSESPSSC